MNKDDLQRVLARLDHLLQRNDLPAEAKLLLRDMQAWLREMFDLHEIATPQQKGAIRYHIDNVTHFFNRPTGDITMEATQELTQHLLQPRDIHLEPWQYLEQHGIIVNGLQEFKQLFDTQHGFYHHLYYLHIHTPPHLSVRKCRHTYRQMFQSYLGQCASRHNDTSTRPQDYPLSLLCTHDCFFRYVGQAPDMQGTDELPPDDVLAYLVCRASGYPGALLKLFVQILEVQCEQIRCGDRKHHDLITKATVLGVCAEYWRVQGRGLGSFPFE